MSIERLEPRIAPALAVSLTGSAPNLTVTFNDPLFGTIGQELVLRFQSGTDNLEYSLDGGATFSTNINGSTASFANISTIAVHAATSGQLVDLNLQQFAFNVNVAPDFGNALQTDVTLADSVSGHAIILNLNSVQRLKVDGVSGDDNLTVTTGQ